jgi:DNA-binding beta-propeller fold protein YncE
VDPVTGSITEIAGSPFSTLPSTGPVGIAYQHDGNFLAVADQTPPSVSVFAVNQVTGALTPTQTIDATADNGISAYLAFSRDDGLAAVSSFDSPGSVVIFCVTDGTWCTDPVQTLPPAEFPQGIAFSPCADEAVVVINGDGITPGTVQVYEVNEEVCPDCAP